jgi:hypothetical protein
MKTKYRIECVKDSYGCVEYFLTYLLVVKRFFGLFKHEQWVTIPIATNARALGIEPMIRTDCLCGTTYGELKSFIKEYPDVNIYLENEFIPKMNELIDKWSELKAMDEDAYDEKLENMGFSYIN